MKRLVLLAVLLIGGVAASTLYTNSRAQEDRRDLYLRQLENNDEIPRRIRADYSTRNAVYGGLVVGWFILALVMYNPEIRKLCTPSNPRQGL
jgi:hypothetical protein